MCYMRPQILISLYTSDLKHNRLNFIKPDNVKFIKLLYENKFLLKKKHVLVL